MTTDLDGIKASLTGTIPAKTKRVVIICFGIGEGSVDSWFDVFESVVDKVR